jgi:septal ring factor EnvC (AmiA/AmiB activator)
MVRVSFIALALPALLLCGLGASGAVAAERNEVRRDIEATKESIAAGRKQQRALAHQARAIRDQVDGLRIRVALAANRVQQEEVALGEIEERLALLRRRNAEHHRQRGLMREGLARSVSALARLERQPAAALLAAPGSMLDAARAGRLLAAALPALHRDAAKVGELLVAADTVRRRLDSEQRRRVAKVAALSGRRQELQSLLQERVLVERQLQQAGTAEGERLAALVGKAQDLQGLLRRLDAAERSRAARQTGVAADRKEHEAAVRQAEDLAKQLAERRRYKLAAEMARALADPKAKNGTEGKAQDAVSPARQRLALAPRQLPFSKIRGRLRLPSKGRRVGHFGESTGFGSRAQGVTLRTADQAQVVAPYDGRVVYAGTFRKYGLILIIAHGEGYHTLLAGLSRLQAVVGQSLLTGEPVGRMGGDGKRSLYIELRRKGTAINPTSWWSSSRERASG